MLREVRPCGPSFGWSARGAAERAPAGRKAHEVSALDALRTNRRPDGADIGGGNEILVGFSVKTDMAVHAHADADGVRRLSRNFR